MSLLRPYRAGGYNDLRQEADTLAESNDAEWLAATLAAWRSIDPHSDMRIQYREDGLAEVLVVSELFQDKQSSEREALFWPAVRDLPRDVLVRMTYSLLLTPDEAARYFEGEAPGGRNGI